MAAVLTMLVDSELRIVRYRRSQGGEVVAMVKVVMKLDR
jgi:hypothetical protein